MAIARRSLQSKVGISIRTQQGTAISPESGPTNSVPFGVGKTSVGATLLNAPGAGKCWVITSLVATILASANNTGGGEVSFTGGLVFSFNAQSPNVSASHQMITTPVALAANTGLSSSFSSFLAPPDSFYSCSGTAYIATIPSGVNPDVAQVIVTSIDSNPPGGLG